MAENRFGKECEKCRDKFRKSEEVYLAQYIGDNPYGHRFTTFLLCTQCAHDHVGDYKFLSYMVYVGGVSK